MTIRFAGPKGNVTSSTSIISTPMPLKESEAIVLRTYPFRESDLLVTLFTRLEGKVRGVARAGKKSPRRFGGAIEPLTYGKGTYEDPGPPGLRSLGSCQGMDVHFEIELSA